MNDETEVVAVLDEVTGTLDGGPLLDVLQDLRIAGLEADDEQPAAGFLHGLQGLAVGSDARGAGPGDAERREFGAELDGAGLLDVEGVVVEEELLDVREVLLGPLHLGGYVVGAALAPGVTGEGLRPEAEGALRGAAACAVERDIGVQQERDVVLGDVHVALVDLGGPGHRVEIFDLRTVRGVLDNAGLRVLVADAEDLGQRLAVGILDDTEVELTAADEVDRFALVESAVGISGNRRPDEADLDGWVRRLNSAGEPVVAGPADGRGEEHKELKALGRLDDLGGRDVVRRRVQQLRALEHSGGISEPDGVPVGLDFAGGRPARTCATVEVLKRGRIQKQCFQRHNYPQVYHPVTPFALPAVQVWALPWGLGVGRTGWRGGWSRRRSRRSRAGHRASRSGRRGCTHCRNCWRRDAGGSRTPGWNANGSWNRHRQGRRGRCRGRGRARNGGGEPIRQRTFLPHQGDHRLLQLQVSGQHIDGAELLL